MEQRLKERLTGAAILVALIVLIVPELFHGHLAERGGKSVNSSEGPPMRSYLIDLGANHSAPMQLGAPPASGVGPAVSAPTAPAEPIMAAPAAIAPPAAPLATVRPTAKELSPAVRRTPARPAVQAVPAKVVARASAPASQDQAAADWSVQLGLYAKRTNAEHMVKVAHTKGFSASLTKPDTKGRYRVRVAGVATRSAAFKLAARLRAAGLPAAAVGPR